MSLQDELLAAIRPHGIELSRLYFRFAACGQERLDYALQGLLEAGEIQRVNTVVLPQARPLQYRCPQCHELRTLDRLLNSGICMHCVSDSLIEIVQRPMKRCPCCQQEFRTESFGSRNYCRVCQRVKQANYASRRLRLDRARSAAAKKNGQRKNGEPTWETLQRMTRMDSALPGASRSRSG